MQIAIPDEKIALTDHAFAVKVQTDPDFRQAIVLDTEAALSYYRISKRMSTKMRSALELLDHLLLLLADHWARDESLREVLGHPEARRLFLFAPHEASSFFALQRYADRELMQLASMADTVFEALLADWEA